MWATSGSRKAAAAADGGAGEDDATKRAEQEVAAAAAAAEAAAAEEESKQLSPSKAAARASKLLEPTFQRPIPALEIDVSGIEAELAEARRAGGSSRRDAFGDLAHSSGRRLEADAAARGRGAQEDLARGVQEEAGAGVKGGGAEDDDEDVGLSFFKLFRHKLKCLLHLRPSLPSR